MILSDYSEVGKVAKEKDLCWKQIFLLDWGASGCVHGWHSRERGHRKSRHMAFSSPYLRTLGHWWISLVKSALYRFLLVSLLKGRWHFLVCFLNFWEMFIDVFGTVSFGTVLTQQAVPFTYSRERFTLFSRGHSNNSALKEGGLTITAPVSYCSTDLFGTVPFSPFECRHRYLRYPCSLWWILIRKWFLMCFLRTLRELFT